MSQSSGLGLYSSVQGFACRQSRFQSPITTAQEGEEDGGCCGNKGQEFRVDLSNRK